MPQRRAGRGAAACLAYFDCVCGGDFHDLASAESIQKRPRSYKNNSCGKRCHCNVKMGLVTNPPKWQSERDFRAGYQRPNWRPTAVQELALEEAGEELLCSALPFARFPKDEISF
jgi:hypothetical protein